MPRTRTRVDDEEALIPRSDMEEIHMTTRKKPKRSCSCCGVKCWFGMFILLILVSMALFYFVYPSVVHDTFNKLIGSACHASGYAVKPNTTIACLVLTSSQGLKNRTSAVDATWGKLCTATYYFYEDPTNGPPIKTLDNTHVVNNITSLEPMSIAFGQSDETISWFLQADDNMYVVYSRLQGLLADKESNKPVYIGGKIPSPIKQAFAMNYAAVAMLVNKTNSMKTESVAHGVTQTLNLTSVSGITADNPISTKLDAEKMEIMSKASVFREISQNQMYSLHVINVE